ncbi:MAG: hypothetical protein Greene041662_231 [Candidatus Peregrinibacteria bacterium Greene0416_62]|nr:MAG: hypothetical protein Greene041662_231 [Candidatus Peregrinibacteria bacterium Greene0416_62]TSC98733.1 MAG: hypothetical protein Greene101449_866 [Candidatus Peregrinibacteria bacterium Greene1014_49]
MKNPSPEQLQQWKSVFPVLDDVISEAPLDAVGVVEFPQGEMQSVGFLKKFGVWDGKSCDIGPYRIIVSSTGKDSCPRERELDAFLAAGSRLAYDHGWKALGRLPKESWIFMRTDALPNAQTLPQRALHASLLGNATHLLSFQENGNTVVRAWPSTPLSPRSEESLSSPLENPESALAFGSLDEILAQFNRNLSSDDHIILEGLLLQKLEDLGGSQVSLRYELLPLVTLDAEIHTGTTASGAKLILLTGNAHNTTDIDSRIDALHRSFKLRHPNVELLEYAFDDGRFPFQTLRLSEIASEEESEQIRGWAVQISRDQVDSAMLITAVNGRQTAISNDAELLRRFLMEEGSAIPLPVTKRPLISRIVAAMLIPDAWLENAPFWMTEIGKSVVSMEQTGDVRMIRISKLRMEN